MFDQFGGLGRLVKGKTVAVKVNLTGNPDSRMGYIPIGRTTWTHPAVIAATMRLLGRAEARRIRLLESPWKSAEPLEECMLSAGWDPALFTGAANGVEFENTNSLAFARAEAREPYAEGGKMTASANDPNGTAIQYDLYRIPFKGGEHTRVRQHPL